MKKAMIVIFALVFACSLAAAVDHSVYPSRFSAAEQFSISDEAVVVVSADAVYQTGYYSVNGSNWTAFILEGTSYASNNRWLRDTATYILPDSLYQEGEHYVIVYSCQRSMAAWSCNDNKWQLFVLNDSVSNNSDLEIPSPEPSPEENCSDGLLNNQELFVDCGGLLCEPCDCTEDVVLSCDVTNGVGSQTQYCEAGHPGSLSDCVATSCTTGYHIADAVCVLNSPSTCPDGEYYFEEGDVCLLSVSGETYFVAPDGDDDTSGSFTQPWKTFQNAFNTVQAGDIVYFRGGVYYTNDTQRLRVSGTETHPIHFFNFPDEQPIIDGSQRTVDVVTMWSGGIGGSSISDVHFKGITVRNLEQLATDYAPMGFTFSHPNNMVLENCVAHNIGYRGFWFYAPGTVYVKNCDAYNVVDPLSDVPGNHGDGFIVWDEHDETANLDSHVVFEGCRAWNNSDDGWDAESEGYIGIYNSWTFDNGYAQFAPGGNGFKLGLTRVHKPELARTVSNSIVAGNLASGLTTNDNACEVKEMNIYNNIAYNNGRPDDDKSGMGFVIYNTINSPEEELVRAFRNNIAYANEEEDIIAFSTAAYTSEFNSWDLPVAVTDDNFVSLDTSQLSAPRKADGSLPDVNFGHLREGSDLIDTGMLIADYHCDNPGSHPGDDCVEWYGEAPDLGPFEYEK